MALFVFAHVAVPLMPVFHQHQHQLCLLRQFCFVFINIERFLVFITIFLIFFSRMHSRKCVQVVTLLITSTFESLFLLSNRSLNRYRRENIHSPKLSFVLLASKSSCKNIKEENLLSTV